MLKENILINAEMFVGGRPQAKQTFLGLQSTMKCNGLNQLQGLRVLYKGGWGD